MMSPNPVSLLETSMISDTALIECVGAACKKVPPLWPLGHFVAVNPFVGMAKLSFGEALDCVHRTAHQSVILPASYFLNAWNKKTITSKDLHLACQNLDCEEQLPMLLQGPPDKWTLEPPVLSVADTLDQERGSRWSGFVTEEVSKWCAAYYDEGQSLWQMPWRDLPLFRAWKRAAVLDRTPEVTGLPGFRKHVSLLPDDSLTAIEVMLQNLGVPSESREEYLSRLLMSVKGWAGAVQYVVREKEMRGESDESLIHFLAIRLAYDDALHQAFGERPRVPDIAMLSPSYAVIWQEALEISHRRSGIGRLRLPATSKADPHPDNQRPSLQAVFCIDVRSELMRRALESADPLAETIGFAGFFGVPMEVIPVNQNMGAARCPVLLLPTHRIREHLPGRDTIATRMAEDRLKTRDDLRGNWKAFKTASITSFPFVESLGWTSAVPLFLKSLVMPTGSKKPSPALAIKKECCPQNVPEGLSTEDRVAVALGALRNMGLTKNFARIVLLCGHGSQSANNPFASSLDCGACGGHAGDANARVAASVLNDPAVRAALASSGIVLPGDTIFLAALHNTSTDEVSIFDLDQVPSSHRKDVDGLQRSLSNAGNLVRTERAAALGIDPMTNQHLLTCLTKRSRDWAEVRPEWGLAGNHTFIAAPRSLTKNLDLGGQVFLHDYEETRDPGFAILELILCAPVVVASWINLQYFASASNNDLFGSGNKLLHNVVGKMGVLEGNGGDLKTGLPWQSVHDGSKLMHIPLRLNVVIKAPLEAIDRILTKHATVGNLVNHRWLHLFALKENDMFHRRAGEGWSLCS